MNKETLSDYGWIIISIVIITTLLAFTSPFGNFLQTSMSETIEDVADQSVNNKSSQERFFNCKNGALTIKKEYQNLPLIEESKTVIMSQGFTTKEEAIYFIASDGNASSVYDFETYIVNNLAWTGTSDEFLVEKYGLTCKDLVDLLNGKETYVLPENLIIPSSIGDNLVAEIAPEAFANANNVRTISLPSTVITINSYAFAHCEALEEIRFGDYLRVIGDGAFLGCKNLRSVNIPNAIEEIGAFAFSDCENLLSVKIHKNPDIVSVDADAFASCRTSAEEIKWIY